MALMQSNDHWAFLEEIEAPMWADLTFEGKSNDQSVNDKWFSTHHLIHQCSSHDLKSALSQLFEDPKTLNFELSVSCSPNLPASVSRSRGKDYDSKKWRGSCQDFAIVKHVISKNLNSGSAAKLKLRSSFTDSKGTSSSTSSVVCAISSTENVMPNISNPLPTHEDLATGSSFEGKQPADGSSSSSTVTTDISHVQQHKLMEVTSQALGTTSTLLSVMRRSLRKSCVTRQASRVEVNDSRRQSSGHKSSSGKSSVSSSSNRHFGVKRIISTSAEHQKKAQDTRSFSKMTHAAMNKTKFSCVSSTLLVQVGDVSSNSRTVGKFSSAKSGHLKASKPKIVRAKASQHSLPQKRDEQNVCLKPKKNIGLAGTGGSTTAVSGKENAIGRIALSQKCDGRDLLTASMAKDQKRMRHNVPQRVGRRSMVSSKGQNCLPIEGRNLENVNQRVYLR